ncbi:MAG TPA: HAMP domain-containing sensor histidine kinase [Candidatus Baltobacteraceae bacterium]|nr:HAMP domain-containing sensor histidine kinase [Candidatus Baltobacteraceae bacterium]
MHFIVTGIVHEEDASRLQDIAHAGLRSVVFQSTAYVIDQAHISRTGLLSEGQGLEWFDSHGHLVSAQGMKPNPATATEFATYTMPIVDPGTRRPVGTVMASIWAAEERERIAYVDYGLIAGVLLAFTGFALAGFAFSRWAAQVVNESMRKLRDFTADASHELRGPIAAISMNADAALRDSERDAARDLRRFEAISDGAAQITHLLGDLLALAAAERPLERDVFAIDLRETLQKVAADYRPVFEEAAIRFEVKTPKLPTYYGNPDQIYRMISNLVENAARYTPSGGTVLLEAEQSSGDIRISVHDTGIGIESQNLDRVFDRFWRADSTKTNGTGLGLSIVRALAQRHGGDVKAISTYGSGSSFVVTLPLRLPTREKSLLTMS